MVPFSTMDALDEEACSSIIWFCSLSKINLIRKLRTA